MSHKQPCGGMAQSSKESSWEATPKYYEFIEVNQREQAATEISMLQLDAGARTPTRGIRAFTRDRKIKDRFTQYNISLVDYVRGQSTHTNL